MSTDIASAAPTTAEPQRGFSYGRMWRAVPGELAYLLPGIVIAIASMTVLATLFFTGVGTIPVFFGLFLVLASLFAARGFGMLELARLRSTTFPHIVAPAWDRLAPGGGSGSWLRKTLAPFVDGHYWLHLLWAMLIGPIITILAWSVGFSWAATALGGVTYWLYSWWLPDGSRGWSLAEPFVQGLDPQATRVVDIVVMSIAGILFTLTLPFVTRGLTAMQWGIARGMLGAFESERLRQQVSTLAASRSAAVAAEGTALRRLERDIHDGPQQRLVRLQMDLAAAERQLASDPETARSLIAEARQQSKDALDELRALSRGFAPPILMDRGLVAALDSFAVRSELPVRITAAVPPAPPIPVEVERNAYFVAAEAVANAVKHAGATGIEVRVALRTPEEGAATWLDVTVSDDGRGGAVVVPGHGLAGLGERVQGLGGTLEVFSPPGGPTVLAAHLPLSIDGRPAERTA